MSSDERRLEILAYLNKVKSVSSKDLAKKFNVNEKTIRRDMEVLKDAYPIESSKGQSGGFKFVGDFKLPSDSLTDKEVNTLKKLIDFLSDEYSTVLLGIVSRFRNKNRRPL